MVYKGEIYFWGGIWMDTSNCEYNQTLPEIEAHHNIGGETTALYHYHNSYEVYLFLAGDVDYYIEMNSYHLKRGDLFAIRPDELHRSCVLGRRNEYERAFFNVQVPVLNSLSSQYTNLRDCFYNRPFGQDNYKHMEEGDVSELITLAHQIHDLENSSAYGADILRRTYASQMLVLVNRAFLKKNEASRPNNIMTPMVSDIMTYIGDHLTEDITLNALSEHLYHNASYISRKFKETTGLTIQQYIMYKRIILAKKYLLEHRSLLDTSQMCGFNEYSSFYRTFMRQVGVSPIQFVKENAGAFEK